MINSLMNELSSCGGISSTGLDSSFSLKNFLSKATFCSAFLLVFLFSCPSINSYTEVISANLEFLEKGPMVRLLPSEAVSERRENRYVFCH